MNAISNDFKLGLGIGTLLGAAVGILSTAAFFKKLYSDAAKKKVEAVIECYAAQPVPGDIEYRDPVTETPERPVDSHPETVSAGRITVITQAEFEDESIGNSKSFLTYYDDGILTNERDIPYSDDELFDTFGLGILDALSNAGKKEVYLRDNELGIDYAVSPGFSNFNPE